VKLRIQGNSIRLRLTKSEVAEVTAAGEVADVIDFGAAKALRYTLESADCTEIDVQYSDSEIRVRIPSARVSRWAAPDQVSIRGERKLGSGGVLKVLVEKDFECLQPRPGEDSADLYINPAKTNT
jgi:hypothetical protein